MKESFEDVVPETCQNQYMVWELLHCMGCNANEPHFADQKTKTVWLCKKFVERLYAKLDRYWQIDRSLQKEVNLMAPTTKFDKCGFLEDKLTYTRDEEGNLIEVADG